MPEVQSMTLENILLLIVALLCGLLSFECTHLPRSGVYTTINRTMWHLAHIIVMANLNLYIVFTQARASLLLIFIYSLTLDFLLFALYHTINTRAAIKRNFLKNHSQSHCLPISIVTFLFLSIPMRTILHGCKKYTETVLHSSFFTENIINICLYY